MLTKESQKKLQKIRDSHKFCCVRIESDYNYVWDIWLTEDDWSEKANHEPSFHSGTWEDLNDAVDEIYKKVKDIL